MRHVVATALLLTTALSVGVAAQDVAPIDYATARLDRRILAVRATGPIRVDGLLDEPDWGTAPVASHFVQREPREGEPASEDTEVRVLYDEQRLYLGVFAHDRHPGEIVTNELKKDFTPSSNDGFEVIFDTFRDDRNGYQFATNAMGAKWDAQMVNEGRDVNVDWDGVWDVRTRVVENGWYAEIVIPFRTLRFAHGGDETWGMNFLRRVRRRNEESYWSPIPRIYSLTRVSLAGTLEGLQGIRGGRELRVKPYIASAGARVGTNATTADLDAGFDAKYGVMSGLTWDFTVNTDFSQVEADTQQVNLTRFDLFFPEKREFFLENAGIFQFGQPASGGGGGGVAGRQNQAGENLILFFSRRIGLSDDAQAIPLRAGTRLTGHEGRYTIGILNIQQGEQGASRATNVTALRLRRDILRNSDIGVMLLNKDVAGPHYNRVIGADANFRVTDELDVSTYVAKTISPESVRQGRDDETAAYVGFSYATRTWEFKANTLRLGDGFNDELGFATRVGVQRTDASIFRAFRPRRYSSWLREIQPHWQIQNVVRHNGLGLETRYMDLHLPFDLQNGATIEGGVNPSVDVIFEPFAINRTRGIVIPPGRYAYNEWFVYLRGDTSARFSPNLRIGTGGFYDGHRNNYEVGGTARVNERFNASLALSRSVIDLRAGSYTTNLVTSRVNVSFNTRMFLNALLQYNTDARQWSSNVRFNVIHRPLSDFFLVINENRDSQTNDLIDRAIIAKVTYLLSL
jgi:hypothetical protein